MPVLYSICIALIPIIILLSFVSGACYIYQWARYRREYREMRTDNPLHIDFYAGLENRVYAEKLTEELKTRKGRFAQESGERLLDARASVLISIVSAGQAQGKNVCHKIQKLPSLAELSEFSFQAARTTFAMRCVMITFSSMLILGILGTLCGVHASVDAGIDNDIRVLTPAFIPSATAALMTIVLMTLRGSYRRILVKLVTQIDLYTLNTLIPCLQPDSMSEITSRVLSDSMRELWSHLDLLKNSMNSVRKVTDTAKEKTNPFFSMLDNISTLLPNIKNHVELYSSQVTEMKTLADKIAKCYRGIQSGLRALSTQEAASVDKLSHEMDALAQDVSQRREKLRSAIESLKGNLPIDRVPTAFHPEWESMSEIEQLYSVAPKTAGITSSINKNGTSEYH